MVEESTLAFAESGGSTRDRWCTFYSYIPEMMVGLNNAFYSFKNGELYEHDLGAVNTFYGVQTPSTIIVIFNEMPSDDKIFHSINLEGTDAWEIALETNYTNSTIQKGEFVQKESRWFAYTRRDEDSLDFKSLATVGISIATSINSNVISFAHMNERTSVGDSLYQIINNAPVLIGTITDIGAFSVTLDTLLATPEVSAFSFSLKNSRTEGSIMRGYYMQAELTSDEDKEVELFAVNATITKSHV